jgi:hypothetical protein
MSKHLPKLIQLSKELPTLMYDAENATGPYQLREVCQKLVSIVGYLLQDVILDAYAGTSSAAPSAVPPPVSRRIAPATATPMVGFPPMPNLPDISRPLPHASSPLSSVAGDVPIQRGVTNVIITEGGTTVFSPGGNRSVLPPGEAVSLEVSADLPPELPEAPEGVANVVLPPGGGMSPDVLAALAGRSQDEPPK